MTEPTIIDHLDNLVAESRELVKEIDACLAQCDSALKALKDTHYLMIVQQGGEPMGKNSGGCGRNK